MDTVFQKDYNYLFKSLDGFSPEDTAWFFPALKALINKYGHNVARNFAKKERLPVYATTLLIKAGLQNVEESLLIGYLNSNDEDEIFDAAICLAIYGYDKGFELLYQFVDKTHPLSKNIIPLVDIVPELKFIKDKRAVKLEKYICEK